jgi:hypothetical protein
MNPKIPRVYNWPWVFNFLDISVWVLVWLVGKSFGNFEKDNLKYKKKILKFLGIDFILNFFLKLSLKPILKN